MPRFGIIIISPFLLFSTLLLPSSSFSSSSRSSSSSKNNILHVPAFTPPPSSSSSSSPFKPSPATLNNNSHRDIHTHTHAHTQGQSGGEGGGAAGKTSSVFDEFAQFIEKTQKEIIQTIETEDGTGAKFQIDAWERDEGISHGATCVLEGGAFIEKGAVSVSIVKGILSGERAAAMSSRGRDLGGNTEGGVPYAAAALSLVLHSANPHLPTFRSDVRYFECQGKGWFGGGADLTPYYLHDEDIHSFHGLYRGLCAPFDDTLYGKYKKWCDDYFYLPGRKEHRGVGGLFFDDLERLGEGEGGREEAKVFTETIAKSFMPSYLPLVRKRRDQSFSEEQKQWMLLRRGRYLEFNLLYDRGVKFGLAGGRFESVMVSAPPLAAWKYNHTPPEGSEEARLLHILKNPQDWA